MSGELNTLRQFLKWSHAYDASLLLTLLPQGDMYDERAILLGRVGEHQSALTLYITQLNDYETALDYCTSVYASYHSVYMDLFQILLSNDRQSQMCQLLNAFCDKLDTLKVVCSLPSKLKLHYIEKFSRQSLLNISQTRR